MIDVRKLRAQTTATAKLIHFNNAGASLMPDSVVKGMKAYLDVEAKMGGYEAATHYEEELKSFYVNAAKLINCSSEEIAYTESATVAWQRAIHSIPFKKGDIILTCTTEYASNYIAYLQLAKTKKIEIKAITNDQTGAIDIEALENAITPDVKLISICHMPTGNGLINSAEEVGQVAQKHNILYLLDACQSVGQYPIDVEKLRCDFLSVTGRKYIRGPRGTGFLYARKTSTQNLEPMFLDLHSAEWTGADSYEVRADSIKYETWESNLSAKYGLSLALNYLNQIDIKEVRERIANLANYMRNEISAIKHLRITDTGFNQSGIVTFVSENQSPDEIKRNLSNHQINVSIVFASSSILDYGERKISETVRASVHYYNTKEEIDCLIELLSRGDES